MSKGQKLKNEIFKNILAVSCVGIGVVLIIISSVLFIKNKIVNNNMQEGIGQVQKITDDFESTSIEIGKTVEQVKEENNVKVLNEENTISGNIILKADEYNNKEFKENEKQQTVQNEKDKQENYVKEEKRTINFIAPVKGEIIREFASDSLVYSETLKEWITHRGIDIKADKTTVVVAACKGIVQSIKNDPRYGLTVIINHADGFQTIYSNLLTAEFVVEGEEVEEGQTIGTVGNSASFEINDDYHLHFELLKENEYQDPKIYINI